MQTKNLIKLYFHVCDKYNKEICWEVKRYSRNNEKGEITDEELITIYLFCVAHEEKYKIKSMYTHIKRYWHSWFPSLPSYQAFNDRLNRLCDGFAILMVDFFNTVNLPADRLKVIIGDSFPVITCSHKRKAKVAKELTAKGYCATKKLHFYGIKIHAIALQQKGTLPIAQYFDMTPANVHDLSATRDILERIDADITVADKAYEDAALERKLQQNNNVLLTPLKNKKGWQAMLKKTDQAFSDVFNKAVSTIRQPIESLFNWINELTHI